MIQQCGSSTSHSYGIHQSINQLLGTTPHQAWSSFWVQYFQGQRTDKTSHHISHLLLDRFDESKIPVTALSEMMRSRHRTFFLIRPPLDAETEEELLGRFCQDLREPGSAFIPRESNRLATALGRLPPPQELRLSELERNIDSFDGSQVQTQLLGIFKVGGSVERSTSLVLRSGQAVVRKAQQVQDFFDHLLEDQQILRELLSLLLRNRGIAFMAVATLTLVDAELTIERNTGSGVRADASQGNVSPPQPAVTAGATRGFTSGFIDKYKTDGRRIFGIEYYKVTKRRFLKSSPPNLGLNLCWRWQRGFFWT